MSGDPLDAVLEKLCSGDAAAAEQVFLAYEPYLRLVVRRQLPDQFRVKFDSIDIVQSIWADVLRGFRQAGWRFATAAHLRAFLVKVTQNRFLDRLRQHRRAVDHERSLETTKVADWFSAPQPQPSDIVQAEDLWEQLLALCPPTHRELLWLKRQGLSLAEIAAQTGLHPSSVRRILYDLALRLACQEEPREPDPQAGS
ncbi:MAG: sigma-70 family RNA polymerase sigma factor [Gemmataceae bacterium]|nr:sigma-70 family RNA polymerase sigma factor [Gemmataceae bacterium]